MVTNLLVEGTATLQTWQDSVVDSARGADEMMPDAAEGNESEDGAKQHIRSSARIILLLPTDVKEFLKTDPERNIGKLPGRYFGARIFVQIPSINETACTGLSNEQT